MRILVIGGNGFIGSFLVPMLCSQGHQVAVLSRSGSGVGPGVRSITGDRNHLEAASGPMAEFGPEAVIDLILSSAAQAEAAVRFFRRRAQRYIVTSSMDVYRAVAVLQRTEPGPLQPIPLTEDSELRCKPLYEQEHLRAMREIFTWTTDDYDKVPAERIVLGDAELLATVLRLPAVYGPGDRLHRLWPYLKRMDDQRECIIVPAALAGWRWSRGFVENVAHGIGLATVQERASGRVYNIAEPEALSELEWAQAIARQAGWTGRFLITPPEGTPAHLQPAGETRQDWVASTARIRSELGYQEPVTVEEGLRRTIDWERRHPPLAPLTRFDYAAEDAAAAGKAPGA
ncbi:MAG: NAD-dependent epimerase/dehydratase family protein [Acidobacteria bacterium]|nr:NAD-dependent epimerase/dehydratase family protein [Acidobacteriota bacterium]